MKKKLKFIKKDTKSYFNFLHSKLITKCLLI